MQPSFESLDICVAATCERHSPLQESPQHRGEYLRVKSSKERSAASARPSNSMRDMQAVLIGQEIRRHGDEFNRILIQRRQAAEAHPQWRPAVPRVPTVFICMGLLIFFGRLLYARGAAYSQSQV